MKMIKVHNLRTLHNFIIFRPSSDAVEIKRQTIPFIFKNIMIIERQFKNEPDPP